MTGIDAQITGFAREVEDDLRALDLITARPRARELFRTLTNAWQAYLREAEAVLVLSRQNDNAGAGNRIVERMAPSYQTAQNTLRELAQFSEAGAAAAGAAGTAAYDFTFTMVIVWAVPAGVKASRASTPSLRDIAPPPPSLAAPLKPLSPITDWVKAGDYPAGAMADDRDYAISFELDVAATGRASACRITASSGSAVVDRTTCDAAKRRARFTLARNAAGEAVAGRYGARLAWSVVPAPRAVPAMPASKPLAADRTVSDATLSSPPLLPAGDSAPKPD
jgi:hypothetical protein